jgi:hypothetical protein
MIQPFSRDLLNTVNAQVPNAVAIVDLLFK